MPRKTRAAAVISLIPLLTIAACGGSDDSADDTQLSVDDLYSGLDGDSFTYVSAGASGEFNTALSDTIIDAFNAETGADFTVQDDECGITKLAGEVEANNVSASLWQFCTPSDYQLAIDEGLLQELDTSVIPVDLLQDGSYTDYGIDAFQFAMGVLYNTDDYTDEVPTSITDIFDTEKFPGKRCISSYPQYQGAVEAAMLNSGKSADEVYPLDMDTVFDELGAISDDVIYYSESAQGYQDMLNGTCSMGLFPNGSAFSIAKNNPDAPFGYTLGDAVVTSSPVGIPKNAPNVQASSALLRWYITDSDSQTAFINQTSYLPAVLLDAPPIPAEAEEYALAGDNLDALVTQDDDYWAENIDAVLKEWNEWLAQS